LGKKIRGFRALLINRSAKKTSEDPRLGKADARSTAKKVATPSRKIKNIARRSARST
jgi:hypothetical protein